MRISDWSSDVCSSDLRQHVDTDAGALQVFRKGLGEVAHGGLARAVDAEGRGAGGAGARSGEDDRSARTHQWQRFLHREDRALHIGVEGFVDRSEEHTSELQSLMRISYAVFCLKKKKNKNKHIYI